MRAHEFTTDSVQETQEIEEDITPEAIEEVEEIADDFTKSNAIQKE